MEGWRVASKGLGPLPRRRGSALARGCGRGGRVALPLARAAAVSTGSRVLDIVRRLEDLRVLEAGDRADDLELRLLGEGAREAVGVDRVAG